MNSNLLKAARVAKGLTQREVAHELGMTIKSYNEKENGVRYFRSNEMVCLADLLELNISDMNKIFFDKKTYRTVKCILTNMLNIPVKYYFMRRGEMELLDIVSKEELKSAVLGSITADVSKIISLFDEESKAELLQVAKAKITDVISNSKASRYDDLPIVLTPKHFIEELGFAQLTTYQLFNSEGFPSFKVGSSWYVNKEDFLDWQRSQKQIS